MNHTYEAHPKRLILLIDSNPEHVAAVTHTLRQSTVNCDVVAIALGTDAIDFLHRRGRHENAPRPDLMLMDWQLSDMQGKDVLAQIKNHETLRRIPVVVFSLCDRSTDIIESYTLQGNCYVVKSSDLTELVHTIRRIEEFWLGVVTLPSE